MISTIVCFCLLEYPLMLCPQPKAIYISPLTIKLKKYGHTSTTKRKNNNLASCNTGKNLK